MLKKSRYSTDNFSYLFSYKFNNYIMEKKLEIGTSVVLKSGGKAMTINKMLDDNQIECVWMLADGQLQRAVLSVDAVTLKVAGIKNITF